MGGSGGGGGYFSAGSDPADLTRRVREEEQGARSEEFEIAVSELIAARLAEYNDRDVSGIQRIIDEILRQLGLDAEDSLSLLFGGSVTKHTYVDGLSDIDALVILSESDARDKTPAEVRDVFAKRLEARFGRDCVQQGVLALTLETGGHSIQLLPAMRRGAGVAIANGDATEWSTIQPRRFANSLTEANKALSGKLIPTIKLAKAIISQFPEPRRLQGYHIEALALKAFDGYSGQKTPKAMLVHLFDRASTLVMTRTRDKTEQSTFVDEYLGGPESVQRRVVSEALDRVARRMRNADGAQSRSRWTEILGDMTS